MDMYTIVRPEYLNHFGSLFGGQMLKWVDEFAWLAAMRDWPKCTFVTRALDNVEFGEGVRNGSILRFAIDAVGCGRTSVNYAVTVFSRPPLQTTEKQVFNTTVTFVRVDENGQSVSLPDASSECLPPTPGHG